MARKEQLLIFDETASLKKEVQGISEELDHTIKFASYLFDNLLSSKQSFSVSPLSSLVNLASILYGVREELKNSACKLLFRNEKMTDKELLRVGQIKHHLLRGKEPHLKMFSLLLVNEAHKVSEEFAQTLYLYFESQILQGKFAPATAERIHEMLQKETNGLVDFRTNLIEFNESLRMVSIDCAHLHGAFKPPFKLAHSIKNFHNFDKSVTQSCKFLHSSGEFRKGSNAYYECEILEIPYVWDNLNFYIILPEKGNLVDNLTKDSEDGYTDTLTALLTQTKMRRKPLDVYIPKFDLKSKIGLRFLLEELGLESLFDGKRSNFVKLVKDNKSLEGLAVHDLIMASFISTNENVEKSTSMAPVHDAETFVCDRPFAFAVTSVVEVTTIVLFVGAVQDLNSK